MTGADLSVNVQIERDVCTLVHQFVQRLDAHARRVGEQLGITAGQVIALRELSEPMTARELATRMHCEPSNVTFILDRLEQQGLIQRQPHPSDRRAKQIVLTPAGSGHRSSVLQRMGAQSPLTPLTTAQQNSLRDLLQAVLAPEATGPSSNGVGR